MDIGNYWQENKRFLTTVGVGVAVFFAVWTAIDSYLGADLRAQQAKKSRLEGEPRQPLFSSADLERAQSENRALVEVCGALRKVVEFAPRPEFRMEKGTPATSRYFNVLERTRDDLKRKSGRAGLALPGDLGMPAVAPTKEAELARYLEALDAIEQTVQLAIEAGCTRIDTIRVKLDSRLLSGKAFDDEEKTLIELKLSGESMPMTRLLTLLQDPRHGRVLQVEKVEIDPARSKNAEEVKSELTLLVAHLNRVGLAEGAEEPK